ncbi:DUF5133 domain-containing protein [Streptomyces sp. NPDC100445]|uniref:DUF5133 domain-containing protein n=1 Tax=Streptomyces sp. NPDC100445 TaxID=3366102 RepID=UPI00381622E6
MLMAHPAVLRDLIEQYDALAALHAQESDSGQARQRMEDIAYMLCVSTGTDEVEAALAVARHHVARSEGGPPPG